jgi:ribosomal protein L11 methyltransferase
VADPFVCLRVRARCACDAERAVAEAWDAGASGVEEQDGGDGTTRLLLYAPARRADAVARALAGALGARAALEAAEPVPDVDWSARWRHGLAALEISPRLAIRPSFVAFAPAAGQGVVVVDPGQAFGTGGHASTRLALELLDEHAACLASGWSALDVGTGSGVLALAALRLGARSAVGLDRDRTAVAEARRNAAANGLAGQARLFAGTLAALGPVRFDVVLANLLRRELVLLLPALAGLVGRDGAAILSGLLAAERAELESALARLGLFAARTRAAEDPAGDRWLAVTATTRGAPASRRGGA